MLRKQDKRLKEGVENLPHQRVSPVELFIKPLDYELCQEKLYLFAFSVLGKFTTEEHFADAFDRDLPQYLILYHHVVLYDDFLELLSFLIDSVND